jgi:hypothetical protein
MKYLAVVFLIAIAPAAAHGEVTRARFLMGTVCEITANDAGDIDAAFDEAKRIESMLSTWRDDSELSRVNRGEIQPSSELSALLQRVDRLSRAEMMSRLQVLTLHLSVALLTATGAVFAWMKYFMKASDEFAVANHPMQPWMLAAHVVIAPLAVFVLGWIFAPHIGPGIANRNAPKRTSGLWAWTPCVPMIA